MTEEEKKVEETEEKAEEAEESETEEFEAARARDFGDNPKVRRSRGEHKKYNKSEPWEVRYRREKRLGKRAPQSAIDFGDDPSIRRGHGESGKYAKSEPWEVRYRREKRMGKRAPFGVSLDAPKKDLVLTIVGLAALIGFGVALKAGYVK